jgi:hypothetical protein
VRYRGVGDRTAIRQAQHSGAFPRFQPGAPPEWGCRRAISPQRNSLTGCRLVRAVEILKSEYDDLHLSKHVLLERLRGGMAQAVASHSTAGQSGRSARQLFFKIPADHWARIETSDPFWRTGDLNYTFREDRTSYRVMMRHYDVRFEPQGVHAIVAAASKPTVAQAPTDPCPEPEKSEPPEEKGPRVNDPHLKAWFELYKGAEDTEERALESARGMVRGKSISRDRIRELRGAQKRGRKPAGT